MSSEYGTLIISLIFSLGCFTSLILGAMFILLILTKSGRFDVYDHKQIVTTPRKQEADTTPWRRLGYYTVASYISEEHGKALVIEMEKKSRRYLL